MNERYIAIKKMKIAKLLVTNVNVFYLSAYKVKNNCRLFERLFKVKKNGVFLFGIFFLFKRY